MRLITKEIRELSRSQSEQPKRQKKHWHGGLTVESAEPVRFAYSSIEMPGFIGGVATPEYIEYLNSISPQSDIETTLEEI